MKSGSRNSVGFSSEYCTMDGYETDAIPAGTAPDRSGAVSAGPQAGPKRISDGELEALCRLLIDEEGRALEKIRADLSVFLHGDLSLKDKILARKDWASNPRLQELLAELRWGDIARSIEDHMRLGEPRPDLEEAHVLLSSFSGTFRSREDITLPLDRMAEELSPSIEDAPDPDSVIRVFTHYLFRIQGFRGNLGDYSDPENSFLHRVLQRKMGIPITLSGVCLLLARRLRWNGRPLPLHGIGLPG